MGELRPVRPVKLFCGILFKSEMDLEAAVEAMKDRYGGVDFRSAAASFDATDYYTPEMGRPLKRIFISFETLIHPGTLPEVKLETNRLEKHFRIRSRAPGRPVNLDPGYLSASKIVLASTKNYAHRFFLQDGIYGEIEFFFKRKGIQCLDWTYPDYRSDAYHRMFLEIRRKYLNQMKNWKAPG